MLQIIITLAIFMMLVLPMGKYMYHIAAHLPTFADPVLDRVDHVLYRLCGIKQSEGMGFKKYVLSLVLTNAVMVFAGYLVLRLQALPLFNPNGVSGMEATLSFHTILSFITNTNLQHYAGESGLSYLSQMLVITFLMFASAATGYAACMAFCRALTGTKKDMGNFYVDVIRIITRILLPMCLVLGLFLVFCGVPQNLAQTVTVATLEGKSQDIAMGPMASLEIIKHLGTNGGGFLGANSAAPLENPSIVTNLVELLSMMLLPGACVVTFGLMFHSRKNTDADAAKANALKKRRVFLGGEGRTLFLTMSLLFVIGLTVCYFAEKAGNPALASIGLNQSMGSMEGKEVRFGIAQSALFTTVTTSFTTGTVNNMHDTLTPLGGMVALLHMMLNCVFGGKGVGLMNMILYAILAVFLCGLMIGRTPEYLGKKVEGREMKLAVLCLIIHPLLILGFSALAVSTGAGAAGITNPGFHGLSQVLYEFASSASNNGSGFEGLRDNTAFWNITTGLVMFFGRYLSIVLQLAIAWSLLQKRSVSATIGTLRTDNAGFAVIIAAVVYIFAALTFFPALALGPIAEHLTLWA
ncbi:MAG: potassium-transporting ATPase subunit KdpA [Ruthenibacterium sp.]